MKLKLKNEQDYKQIIIYIHQPEFNKINYYWKILLLTENLKFKEKSFGIFLQFSFVPIINTMAILTNKLTSNSAYFKHFIIS